MDWAAELPERSEALLAVSDASSRPSGSPMGPIYLAWKRIAPLRAQTTSALIESEA